MLVFPQWRTSIPSEGCRVQRWMPAERFAPYLARPVVLPLHPPQDEDEDSMGGSSSPERGDSGENSENVCGWRGCGLRFPNISRLSAHVARVHAQAHSDGLFYCCWKDCARPQRGFNARYKMLVHVRTHTNERPHTCNQCQKSFSRAENLKIHLRSHSGEKPYVCPYEGCGKAYSNSSDRFKHTRTHTVDKPYCCKVPGCNKRYTDPSSLRKHVKTYKHFTSEKDKQQEQPIEQQSPESQSPVREVYSCEMQNTSPLRLANSPPIVSPKMLYNQSIPRLTSPTFGYVPKIDHASYVPSYETLYPVRVPIHEMSYVQYSQMYDHAYRNYYTNNLSYSVFRSTSTSEDLINYDQTYTDIPMSDAEIKYPEELPLNLICTKRLECKPIEQLVKRTDLPLDLSTKS